MAKPTPLVNGSDSPAVREALGEARAALGSEADVQRLRAKLGELPSVPPSGGGGGGGTASGVSAKVATIAAASVLIIAGALLFASRAPAPAPARPSAPKPTVVMPAPEQPVAAAPAPAIEPAAPALAPEPATPAPRKLARPKGSAPAQPEAAAPAPAAPKELELLMSAQDALEASPQRALGLLERHAELYPSGNFALERESLAIDALRKLGRTTAAQARARAFIARFPKASNAKHLQRWLDESATIDHKDEAAPLPTP